MKSEALLTVGMSYEMKVELQAISDALGMSGMGAVVRAVLEGRLPALKEIPQRMFVTPGQRQVYEQAKALRKSTIGLRGDT